MRSNRIDAALYGRKYQGMLSKETHKSCNCCFSEGNSPQNESFLKELSSVLDSILNGEDKCFQGTGNNPYNSFGSAHRSAIEKVYRENQNQELTIPLFRSEYVKIMSDNGYARELHEKIDYQTLKNRLSPNQPLSFSKLRFALYEEYNASKTAVDISELVFSMLLLSKSRLQSKTILAATEALISKASISEYEVGQFMKALAIATNNVDLPISIYTTARGDWKSCAGMAVSFVGGLMGGPFTMALGLAGMALAAEGCEQYLDDEFGIF